MALNVTGLVPVEDTGVPAPSSPSLDLAGLEPLEPEQTFLGNVGEVAKGVVPGAVRMAGTTAKGLSALNHGSQLAAIDRVRSTVESLNNWDALSDGEKREAYFGLDRAPVNPEIERELRTAMRAHGHSGRAIHPRH